MTLTVERLREVLHYDRHTGEFTWINSHSTRPLAGKKAGSFNTAGYVQIYVDNKNYYGHRLAWLYVNGVWPTQIDHIDGNRSNNAIDNLRLATTAQNQANRKSKKRLKGVSFNHRYKKYQARLRGGSFGWFDTAEEAHEHYRKIAVEAYGAFARFG